MLSIRTTGLSAVLVLAAGPALAVALYDPAAGTLPAAQGWSTLSSPAGGTQLVSGGLLRFDSSAIVGSFGNGLAVAPPLDTDTGFRLRWDLRLTNEGGRSSNDRAGFSLLMQGADQTKALELGFWGQQVWALAHDATNGFVRDGTLTAALDTTAALRRYTLTVQQHQFSLDADGSVLFSGALRDYPTLGLSTVVYGTSNFLFFGDNSASGGWSTADVGRIELLPVPEPGTAALWLSGLATMALWSRRRRSGL